MKAKRYTIAMLIALIFATAGIKGQSARRPVTKENKERARTESIHKKETTSSKARSNQPVRKAEVAQTRSHQARAVQPARKERPNNKQTVKDTRVNQVRRPVSMSTNKNPRSTYRKPNKLVVSDTRFRTPVKSSAYHKRHYYGGHYYHYAYPTKRVKIHYHHNTHVNHYNVLYYPSYGEIYWTRGMYRDYHRWYPGFHWSYSYGHRIQTISIWDAKYNLGEVAMVYGRVYASWYNEQTDDFLLFFGGDFPYQQFTAVVPGHVARKFSWRPARYFLGEHLTITGLITTYDGSPEIVIKNKRQISLY
jgi:hypothetical protein